jgi:hypothetical protein
MHWPFWQLVARVGLQASQVAPPVPHWFIDDGDGTQVFCEQQPLHVAGLHAQWLAPALVTQARPPTHGASPPQVQMPATQRLPVGAQSWQAVPATPQALPPVPSWHMPFASQQPFGQVLASQMQWLATQCWPATQATPAPHLHAPPVQLSEKFGSHWPHMPPPVPQSFTLLMKQLLPTQQPLGQLCALQPQMPLRQARPPPHAG